MLGHESVTLVFDLLKGVQSQDASTQQSSEAALNEFSRAAGYASCLVVSRHL